MRFHHIESQRSDFKGADALLGNLPEAETLIGDKGCDSNNIRNPHTVQDITPCIPSKKNRKKPAEYCKTLYKTRHKIKNLFAKFKAWRRIATRYVRCAHAFRSAISNDDRSWSVLAGAIYPFSKSGDGKDWSLSEQAHDLLVNAPSPVDVAKQYIERIMPMGGWSGELADIIAARTNALDAPSESDDLAVAEAVKAAVIKGRGMEKRERDRQRRRDEQGEQRFE